MPIDLEELRLSYMPQDGVRVLLVGESPPQGGTFFYKGDSVLYRATRAAFGQVFSEKEIDSSGFLSFFRDQGFYLDDLCHEPMNGLPDDIREAERRRAIPGLGERMCEYSLEAVIVVMLGIKDHVIRAMRVADVACDFFRALPFPNRFHLQEYVDGLSAALAEMSSRGLIGTRE